MCDSIQNFSSQTYFILKDFFFFFHRLFEKSKEIQLKLKNEMRSINCAEQFQLPVKQQTIANAVQVYQDIPNAIVTPIYDFSLSKKILFQNFAKLNVDLKTNFDI